MLVVGVAALQTRRQHTSSMQRLGGGRRDGDDVFVRRNLVVDTSVAQVVGRLCQCVCSFFQTCQVDRFLPKTYNSSKMNVAPWIKISEKE